MATANTPMIVMGHAETAAARFVADRRSLRGAQAPELGARKGKRLVQQGHSAAEPQAKAQKISRKDAKAQRLRACRAERF